LFLTRAELFTALDVRLFGDFQLRVVLPDGRVVCVRNVALASPELLNSFRMFNPPLLNLHLVSRHRFHLALQTLSLEKWQQEFPGAGFFRRRSRHWDLGGVGSEQLQSNLI